MRAPTGARIPACAGLLVLAALLPAGAPGFGSAPDYHEPTSAPLDPGLETDAYKLLEADVGSGSLVRDGALTWAARDLCEAVHGATAGGGEGLHLDPQLVEAVTLGRGVTDAVVTPIVMSSSDPGTALASWRSHVASDPGRYAGRVVGLGARELGSRWILAALSVERFVKLEPVARSIEVSGKLVLRGRKVGKVKDLRVMIAFPSGEVGDATVKVKGKKFESVLVLDGGDGVYMVEVLGDTGYGPRVLNLFPVTVGGGHGLSSVVLSVPWRKGPSRNAWMLFDLVVADRGERGLGGLAPDARLAEVALAHCRDMRDGGYFGHVSPQHGGIEERAAHLEGLEKVAEVIALASSPQRAFGNLLSSPAHASSLHDPGMTHMGVGKVKTSEGMLFTIVIARRK